MQHRFSPSASSSLFHLTRQFAKDMGDTRQTTFIKQLIFLIALCCVVFGIIWALMYAAIFSNSFIALLPLLFSIIVGTTMIVSHLLKNHRPLVYAQIFCITWIPPVIQWSIGSMDHSGVVIVWSFLGVTGAVIFLSFRQSAIWFVMFVIIVVISSYINPQLTGDILSVSDHQKTLFYLLNLCASTLVLFISSAWFVRRIQQERGRADELLIKLKSLFGQHVSTEVADELLDTKHPDAGSKLLEATVMFLDIRDFTVFADSRPPHEVAAFQNLIIGEYINLVKAHHGIVLQILGDGILAVFGAPRETPDHSENAVNAGLAMITRTKHLVKSGAIPDIKIGIGLHCGKVLAGEIGNQYRKSYSVTGSNVIIASRIEQLNKKLDSQFLISEAVKRKIQADDYRFEFTGRHQLKGISRELGVYEIV